MTKNHFIFILFLTITSSLFIACGSDDDDKDAIPDVSNIKVDVKVHRFEQDVFALDTNNMAAGMTTLQQKYPLMSDVFASQVINDGSATSAVQAMNGFVRSKSVRMLNDTVQIAYKDINEVQKDFTQAFQFVKYYFPKKAVPEINTFISEYSYGAFTYGDSVLAVGLDLFLGANHTGYDPTFFPKYMTRTMNKAHLVSKAMEAVAQDLAGDPRGENRLLDAMIHNGKVLYLLDKFTPHAPDSVKFEYTTKQMNWCAKNEAEVWAYLLSKKMLYSVKQSEWTKLVNPSPAGNTDMPTDSPGRVGNWVGYRIIKSYMKKHPNMSLEQLMAIKDAQKILDESKYKPKRR